MKSLAVGLAHGDLVLAPLEYLHLVHVLYPTLGAGALSADVYRAVHSIDRHRLVQVGVLC